MHSVAKKYYNIIIQINGHEVDDIEKRFNIQITKKNPVG